jgi:hypothetical protein
MTADRWIMAALCWLTTGLPAGAAEDVAETPQLRWDCRHGFMFSPAVTAGEEDLDGDRAASFIVNTRNSRAYKGCAAFLRCVEQQTAGKVKHCYANDKRWHFMGEDLYEPSKRKPI